MSPLKGQYPGFISAMAPSQKPFFDATFDKQNPACAALGGCLCRREYRLAEKDPRMWRMIDVCNV